MMSSAHWLQRVREGEWQAGPSLKQQQCSLQIRPEAGDIAHIWNVQKGLRAPESHQQNDWEVKPDLVYKKNRFTNSHLGLASESTDVTISNFTAEIKIFKEKSFFIHLHTPALSAHRYQFWAPFNLPVYFHIDMNVQDASVLFSTEYVNHEIFFQPSTRILDSRYEMFALLFYFWQFQTSCWALQLHINTFSKVTCCLFFFFFLICPQDIVLLLVLQWPQFYIFWAGPLLANLPKQISSLCIFKHLPHKLRMVESVMQVLDITVISPKYCQNVHTCWVLLRWLWCVWCWPNDKQDCLIIFSVMCLHRWTPTFWQRQCQQYYFTSK